MNDEEKIIKYPYYEVTYLDDINEKHLAVIYDDYTLDTIKERFTILDWNKIEA